MALVPLRLELMGNNLSSPDSLFVTIRKTWSTPFFPSLAPPLDQGARNVIS